MTMHQMTLAVPDVSTNFFLFPHGHRETASLVYPGTGIIKRITLDTTAPNSWTDLQIHDLIAFPNTVQRLSLTRVSGTVSADRPNSAAPSGTYQPYGHDTVATMFGVFATTFNADTLRQRFTPVQANGADAVSVPMQFDTDVLCTGGMMVYAVLGAAAVGRRITIDFEPWKSGATRKREATTPANVGYR